jgi:hypothetical protein
MPASGRGRRLFAAVISLLITATVPALPASAAPATFTHPGVLVSAAQLDFVRAQVNANAQPWRNAYNQMTASKYASLSRTPKPRATVECGPVSNPNNGCTDEREDAIAAYTDALAWYITGNTAYAQKAIQLMDAWSATIRDHTNSNAPLQTGWAGASWTRAAELIKYAYKNWPNSARFGTMLRNVYLPKIVNGSNSNGNWELVMLEASIGIAVFLEDRAVYDKVVARYRLRVPAYVYLNSDGDMPKTIPGTGRDTRAQLVGYWQGQSTFSGFEGLTQETCRDFVHVGYGIASIADFAETTRIQGQDLYPEVADRLRTALGFQTKFEQGAAVPGNLCNGTLTKGLGPVTEVGYNELNTRMHIEMANTKAYTESHRPQGTNNLFVEWQTLTHAQNPN